MNGEGVDAFFVWLDSISQHATFATAPPVAELLERLPLLGLSTEVWFYGGGPVYELMDIANFLHREPFSEQYFVFRYLMSGRMWRRLPRMFKQPECLCVKSQGSVTFLVVNREL